MIKKFFTFNCKLFVERSIEFVGILKFFLIKMYLKNLCFRKVSFKIFLIFDRDVEKKAFVE